MLALSLRADMQRRQFIVLLGGGATVVSPLAARAQVFSRTATHCLALRDPTKSTTLYIDAFLKGMQDLGYVEGHTFDMVYRFSDGYQDDCRRWKKK